MKKILLISLLLITSISLYLLVLANKENINEDEKNSFPKEEKHNQISALIIKKDPTYLTLLFEDNTISNINSLNDDSLEIGNTIKITYDNELDPLKEKQDIKIINYQKEKDNFFLKEDGFLSSYYNQAYQKLKELSQKEKIGELFLLRYPDKLNKVNYVGGYVFYAKDFKNKSKSSITKMITSLQENRNIKLLTAVDEEGGPVTRLSHIAKFSSPQELYKEGGFSKIEEDTINKSKLLEELGLNLNLAPVVDISTNKDDYIYKRTLGEDEVLTSKYAKTVIEASKNYNVSYTLKHFPGYGNNIDTHYNSSLDTRTYEELVNKDLIPFEEGIKSGAEAILVSHNIVSALTNDPASLSIIIHNLLRKNLNFKGIVITDDISMKAVSENNDSTLKALLAGNNLIITSNFQESYSEISKALQDNIIPEEYLDYLVLRNLAWKYSKNLINEQFKFNMICDIIIIG